MKNILSLGFLTLLVAAVVPVASAGDCMHRRASAGDHDNVKVTFGVCVIGSGTMVTGNIDVEPGAGVFINSGAIVRGSIVKKGPGSLEIFGSSIGGNVKAEDGSSFRLHNNSIRGNLELIGNSGFPQEVFANFIGGNLKFEKNVAAAPVNISNNNVRGNLECKDNVPQPFGGGNTAASKKDQCAGL